jgi:hypothetical protein
MSRERAGLVQKIGRGLAAGVLAGAALLPGAKAAIAQDVEPVISNMSVECPRGGFGVVTVEWSGPHPYDVTAITPVSALSFERGNPDNKLVVDLSGVKYKSGMEAPSINYYLKLSENPSGPELRRKLFQQVNLTEACPQ